MNATLKSWLDNAKDESEKKIINHLVKRATEDKGLAKDIEGKEWSDCYAYIRSQAQKQAVNGVACIDDPDVYEWAEDFCRMSAEDIEKLAPKAKTKTSPKTTKRNVTNAAPKSKRVTKTTDDDNNVVSMFDDDDVDTEHDEVTLGDDDDEQLSLFD